MALSCRRLTLRSRIERPETIRDRINTSRLRSKNKIVIVRAPRPARD